MANDPGGDGPVVSGPLVDGTMEPLGVTGGQAVGAPAGRTVQVSISIAAPAGSNVPQSLQRSSRQIASAVRRAIGPY